MLHPEDSTKHSGNLKRSIREFIFNTSTLFCQICCKAESPRTTWRKKYIALIPEQFDDFHDALKSRIEDDKI
jgi:hypothetical protein